MITGGSIIGGSYKSLRRAYQRQVSSVHIKHHSIKYSRSGDDDIIFFERDANGIRQPYNDPLVIMLAIEGFNTRRVLVDNGSSEDIMYMTTYQQLMLDPKRLRPFDSSLVNFNRDRIYLQGIISLSVIAGTYPTQITNKVDWLSIAPHHIM